MHKELREDVERLMALRELSRQFPQKLEMPATHEPIEQILSYKHDLMQSIDLARDVNLFLHLADLEQMQERLSEEMYMRFFNLTILLRKAITLTSEDGIRSSEAATLLSQVKNELIELVDSMDYREVYEFVSLNPFLLDPEECARLEQTKVKYDQPIVESPELHQIGDSVLDKSLGADSDSPAREHQLPPRTILNTDMRVLQTTYNKIAQEREERLMNYHNLQVAPGLNQPAPGGLSGIIALNTETSAYNEYSSPEMPAPLQQNTMSFAGSAIKPQMNGVTMQ